MPVYNADIAAVFDEIADLLEFESANPFRVRAYRNAARTLRDLNQDVAAMIAQGEDVTELPGIGEDLGSKIKEIVETGTAAMLEGHRKKMPATLTDLLKIPGLGTKRVQALYHKLGIHTLDDLRNATQEGRVKALQGFGAKIEQRILEQLTARTSETKRFKLAIATQYAESLIAYLKASAGVEHIVAAGSYRRAKETIGDLDLLVTARSGSRGDRAVCVLSGSRRGSGSRHHQSERPSGLSAPSRFAGCPGSELRCRPPIFYGEQGTQCAASPVGAAAGAQAE